MNKKTIIIATSVLIIITMSITALLSSIFSRKETRIENTFSFRSVREIDKKDLSFSFCDSFFSKDSSRFNPDLAKMSIRVAVAAFNSAENGPEGIDDYSEKSKNIVDLFEKCNFQNIEINDDYKIKPEENTIGVCVGTKRIKNDRIIAVAIRGGGYESEWAGNFNLVTDGAFHPGFLLAAQKAENFVDKYLINLINDKTLRPQKDGRLKIWISGFSRGGAVANLVARYYSDYPGINKNNVFGYTFEAPAPTCDSTAEEYPNIHNVVLPNDLVPKVVPSRWGYHRYGTDHMISELTSMNFDEYENDLLEKFRRYTDDNETTLPNFSRRGDALDKIVELIASKLGKPDSTLSKLISKQIRQHFVEKDFTSEADKTGGISLSTGISVLKFVIGDKELKDTISEIDNFEASLMKAHYPELCMAWLDTI